MKNANISTPAPSGAEMIWGCLYLAFHFFLLPTLLRLLNGVLPRAMSGSELNFAYFGIGFLAVLWIFHAFLSRNLSRALQHPVYCFQAVILGFVAYFLTSLPVSVCIRLIHPGFVNANDAAISSLAGGCFFLMSVGTVVLVPLTEECLFRGLIFRGLYGKSRALAYIVSILAFAAIHIVGYLNVYTPLELLLSLLQYIPAGLWLAWAYVKADTIFAPILIHAAVNFVGIYALR